MNEAENADGVQMQVTVPSTAVEGDTVAVTVTDPAGNSLVVSSVIPLTWNGLEPIEVTVPAFVEGQYSATAVLIDGEGNESLVSNQAVFVLDETAPGADVSDNITQPVISIPESLPNGEVDATDVANGVQVSVFVPSTTEIGDTITLTVIQPDETETTVEATVPSTWNGISAIVVTIPTSELPEDGDYVLRALTDKRVIQVSHPTLLVCR